jgi:hypothetical protein
MTISAETTEYGEPIDLKWSQQLAAFWSILWPCWLLGVLLAAIFVRTTDGSMTGIQGLLAVIHLLGQGILSFRLVRKDYRTFWIGVLREGEPLKRHLAFPENIRVWLQLIWPQLAFLVALSLFSLWTPGRVSPETVRSLNSLSQWVYILAIGPAAIRWAMYTNYPGFRLQAYRRNRKIHLESDSNASNVFEH